jgi:hypothetical protein
MLGVILGDFIGSVFEGSGLKITEFPLLTPKCVRQAGALRAAPTNRWCVRSLCVKPKKQGLDNGMTTIDQSRRMKLYENLSNYCRSLNQLTLFG